MHLKNHSVTEKKKWRTFDDIVQKKLDDSVVNPTKPVTPYHVTYSDGVNADSDQLPYENDPIMPDSTVVFEKPTTNQWIHAELYLPQGELPRKEKVISRTKDKNGDVKDLSDLIPFLNTFAHDA